MSTSGADSTGTDGKTETKTDATTQDKWCNIRPTVMLDVKGKYYGPWKIATQLELEEQQVWGLISENAEGGIIEPPLIEPPTRTTKTTAEQQQFDKWKKADFKGKRIIIKSLEPMMIKKQFSGGQTLENSTTISLWENIKTLCTSLEGGKKRLAFEAFSRFTYDTSRSAELNLERFEDIMNRLELGDVSLDIDIQMSRLLDSLPESWESFKQAHSGDGSFDTLKTAVLQEANRQQQQHSTDHTTALFARTSLNRPRGPEH